jgi:hypothetical protein
MNAQQQLATPLHNVRRPNSKNDVHSVQRVPSSDVTLLNNSTAANEIMTQLQQISTMTQLLDMDKERDLQIDPGTILDIVDTACDLVGSLMLLEGTAVCDCTLTLSLEFGCEFVTDVCTGSFCTTPDVQGAFDILQTRVTFTYCSNEATFNDATLPDFCVSVGGDLIPPAVSSTSNEEPNEDGDTSVSEDRARIFGKRGILRKVQFLDTISVTVDDRACRSASICNKGQGYTFDCTNIHPLLKQSTCTPIQTLTNLQQAPGSVTFLPQLDDPPTSSPVTSIISYFNTSNFQSFFKLLLQNP